MSDSSSRHGAAALAALCLAGALAGCGGGDGAGEAGPGGQASSDVRSTARDWFPACPEPADASPAPAPSRSAMPSVSLECLGGPGRVDLSAPFGRPVVVNVWASWCRPCREELPRFQRYADSVADEVIVLGVVSLDTREASLALARELDVRFPTLYDREGALAKALGRTALPVTVLIDASGRLAHVYNGRPLTEDALAALVDRHLAVT